MTAAKAASSIAPTFYCGGAQTASGDIDSAQATGGAQSADSA